MEARSRVEAVFHGRVQGVGFRATVQGLARALPVTGWVRNEPDGSVRMEAQGDREDVDRLIGEVEDRMGRFIARRTLQEIPTREVESGFEIRA